jgi:hypothetical protein
VLGDTDGSTGVPGGGLDPDVLIARLPQHPPVANTVQRHTAGEAQVALPGALPERDGHGHHQLLRDLL